MKNDFEKRLQRDGQKIQAQAESRLKKFDFDEHVLTAKGVSKEPVKYIKNWYLGLAAAISLSVLVGAFLQSDKQITDSNNQSQLAASSFLTLKRMPLSIEENVNRTLLDEQQAIISDINTLKQQLLPL